MSKKETNKGIKLLKMLHSLLNGRDEKHPTEKIKVTFADGVVVETDYPKHLAKYSAAVDRLLDKILGTSAKSKKA